MSKKLPKTEVQKQINEFFSDIKDKTPKQIKKIKKLAMRNSIQLKELRKKFCKKCYSVYRNPKIRIKNKMKSVICKNCNRVNRWRMK